MSFNGLLVALIVCLSVRDGQGDVTYQASTSKESQNDSSIDVMVMMRIAKVVLKPPTNITTFMLTSTEAVIAWLPPEIYDPRPFFYNQTHIDPPTLNETIQWYTFNDTDYPDKGLASIRGWNKEVVPHVVPAGIEERNGSDGADAQDGYPVVTPDELCHSLEFFANYTVGINDTEEAAEDYLPHLIPLKDVFKPRNVTVTAADKEEIVSFSQGCVLHYSVYYYQEGSEPMVVQVNASERPEVRLTSLKPGTNYSIKVAAVFVAHRTLNSSLASFTTLNSTSSPAQCWCDIHGMTPGSKCNGSNPKPCQCRGEYKGDFCEQCNDGYYRTAPYFPCNRCPCADYATKDNSCRFKEGFLTCGRCKAGYTGAICHMCDYGYYRHHRYCVPCHCNLNHNRSKPFMCDAITGACHCMFNTSGMNCEVCHQGFVGDALHHRNCAPISSAKDIFKVLPQAVVAGICVGVILTLSFIVGCVIYWRMAKNPPKRPFWTVELKDDHEGVNFNTVPNDDFQHMLDPKGASEDMDFYERQGGAAQSNGGNKRYARLQENV